MPMPNGKLTLQEQTFLAVYARNAQDKPALRDAYRLAFEQPDLGDAAVSRRITSLLRENEAQQYIAVLDNENRKSLAEEIRDAAHREFDMQRELTALRAETVALARVTVRGAGQAWDRWAADPECKKAAPLKGSRDALDAAGRILGTMVPDTVTPPVQAAAEDARLAELERKEKARKAQVVAAAEAETRAIVAVVSGEPIGRA